MKVSEGNEKGESSQGDGSGREAHAAVKFASGIPFLAEALQVGDQRDHLAVGIDVTALLAQFLRDLLRLLLASEIESIIGRRPRREIGTPSMRWTRILAGSAAYVGVGLRTARCRKACWNPMEMARGSSQVVVVPRVIILSADAREVRAVALRAPLEGMIVDRLPEPGVVAVTHDVRHERADHLRMAVVAALADIEVAARQFQRRVGTRSMRSSVCIRRSMVSIGMIWMRPPTTTASRVSTVNGRALTNSWSYQSAQALPRDSKWPMASERR